jgi:hypothetical protein
MGFRLVGMQEGKQVGCKKERPHRTVSLGLGRLVSGLRGHLRMQGYEASEADSRRPNMYIHLGAVAFRGPQQAEGG